MGKSRSLPMIKEIARLHLMWLSQTQRLIGDAAKNQVAMNPSNTVFDAKRLIGRKFDDPAVQSDMKHWPFKVIQGEGARPKIQVEVKGEMKAFSEEPLLMVWIRKARRAQRSDF
uniref:Uncharacterized protein n=1 Tax=Meloidogyne enterolobii TaxID=390850 RepID=A0A6V7WRV9_MELEN|nr:unnamed protein product [Meloidogyne enterolobii]